MAAAGDHLAVSEIFGPTLQGEGVSAGRAAAFLRLAGCYVGCGWCDTRYSWDDSPDKPLIYDQLDTRTCWARVEAHLPAGARPLLVVTGGEPLLQGEQLVPVLRRAHAHGCRVEIETSGTQPPGDLTPFVDLFTVSPKLEHSGVAEARRLIPALLNEFASTSKAVFKFVVRGPQDLDEVAAVSLPYPDVPVIIMPLGTTSDRIAHSLRALAGPVAGRGWTLTGRMHIDLWGNVPGR